MAILWILEKPGLERESLAATLQGDFAIRCIASVKSLVYLSSLKSTVKPEALLINDLDFQNLSPLNLRQTLNHSQDQPLKIYLSDRVEEFTGLSSLEKVLSFCHFRNFPFVIQNILSFIGRSESAEEKNLVFQFGTTIFDYEKFILKDSCSNEIVSLPLKEAKILKLLFDHIEECVDRDQMITQIWSENKVSKRTIDSHISRLRKRLELVGLTIESRYGSGYILRSDAETRV